MNTATFTTEARELVLANDAEFDARIALLIEQATVGTQR